MASRIVVVGGGPGGSTTAALLAARGHHVTVLEKAKFPRFHLGESLLPETMRVLDELALLPTMHERFLVKRGAQFFGASAGAAGENVSEHARFDFDGAFHPKYTYSFQVPRDEFDQLLLQRAAALGADVREEWAVTAAIRDAGTDRIVGVTARAPDGRMHDFPADLVVDASGRDAMFARGRQGQSETRKIEGLDGTSIYAHWTGTPRDEGNREGDIRIVLFDGGWCWVIPFKDGRTSIGVVLSREGMRARARSGQSQSQGQGKSGLDIQQLYIDTLREAEATRGLLDAKDAKQLWPAEATADFSYRVTRMHGAGWLAVGDAAGFIDPLFSTGVHLAMKSASFAAAAIDAADKASELSGRDAASLAALDARFSAHEAHVRSGAELFVAAVRAFYEGRLLPYLFTANPRVFLRRTITSMLAGDVFGNDARWKNDMRTRLATLNVTATATATAPAADAAAAAE